MGRGLPLFLAVVLLSAGCSTGGLADLPLPAPGLGAGGYRLTAVFANALNLPERAKVKLAGADIGEVESMAAVDFRAVTTLRIRHDVTLTAGSTAQLRTATPLGDVFVAITPPDQPGTGMLVDGDTIPIDQTGAAATVESVLSSAAILVNGGAVHNLTNVVNGTGRAAGQDGQAFGRMIGKSNELLGKLNARSGQLDAAMTETAQLARALDGKSAQLGQVLHAAAPATATLQENAGQISDLVLLLGDTARELGKFPSIAGTDTSGRSVVADANAISRSWNDVVLDPETSLLSLNRLYAPFIKITAGSAISGRAGIDRLVLGAIPDVGFGRPGLPRPQAVRLGQVRRDHQVLVVAATRTRRRAGARSAGLRCARPHPMSRAWASGLSLVLLLMVSVTYLLVGVLHVRPLASSYPLTIQLAESGGLLPNQDVTLHGVRIGSVDSLTFTGTGVNAVVNVDGGVRVPASRWCGFRGCRRPASSTSTSRRDRTPVRS